MDGVNAALGAKICNIELIVGSDGLAYAIYGSEISEDGVLVLLREVVRGLENRSQSCSGAALGDQFAFP